MQRLPVQPPRQPRLLLALLHVARLALQVSALAAAPAATGTAATLERYLARAQLTTAIARWAMAATQQLARRPLHLRVRVQAAKHPRQQWLWTSLAPSSVGVRAGACTTMGTATATAMCWLTRQVQLTVQQQPWQRLHQGRHRRSAATTRRPAPCACCLGLSLTG